MTATLEPTRRTFLFGGKSKCFHALHPRRVNKPDLREVLRTGRKTDLWIVNSQVAASDIVQNIEWKNPPTCGAAIILDDVSATLLEAMEICFSKVAFSGSHGAMLLPEELAEAMTSNHRKDLAIAGTIDPQSKVLTFWRGDLSKLVVPLSAFENTSAVETPDFSQFAIIDYGQTIRFGEYEAAFDSLLYEFDPRFRQKLKKKRRESEQSFGASLRRLRKQRRLTRDDFTPLTAKTIARIERGEVSKPRGATLRIISDRLGVASEDIESY